MPTGVFGNVQVVILASGEIFDNHILVLATTLTGDNCALQRGFHLTGLRRNNIIEFVVFDDLFPNMAQPHIF